MEATDAERPAVPFRAGFVALVGRPNTGKSTLLNAYLGQKVAIVSPKPQTTRTIIRGAITLPHAQVIFLDTPGMHRPLHRLGEYMVAAARRSIQDADVVVWLVDLTVPPNEEDRLMAEVLEEKCQVPLLLALNKADAVSDPEEAGRPYRELAMRDGRPIYQEAIVLSALQGMGRQELLDAIVARLPESPPYYPEDFLTDQPLRVIAAEWIREQVLHFTRQEVPHGVAVVVEEYKERSADLTYIAATIYVEKETHKEILLGRGGQMLKRIGQAAREALETYLGTRVYLDLWVKVRKNWRKHRQAVKWMGYDITQLT